MVLMVGARRVPSATFRLQWVALGLSYHVLIDATFGLVGNWFVACMCRGGRRAAYAVLGGPRLPCGELQGDVRAFV